MKYIPLNFGLLLNPYNWAIITLMMLIFGFGVSLVTSASSNKSDVKPIGA